MKIKFEAKFSPLDWITLGAFILLITLASHGNYQEAIEAVTKWIKALTK